MTCRWLFWQMFHPCDAACKATTWSVACAVILTWGDLLGKSWAISKRGSGATRRLDSQVCHCQADLVVWHLVCHLYISWHWMIFRNTDCSQVNCKLQWCYLLDSIYEVWRLLSSNDLPQSVWFKSVFQAHCPFRLCSEAPYHPCKRFRVCVCLCNSCDWPVPAARIGGGNAIVPQTCTWGGKGHMKTYEGRDGRGFMRVQKNSFHGSLPTLCTLISSVNATSRVLLWMMTSRPSQLLWLHVIGIGLVAQITFPIIPKQFSGCTSVAAWHGSVAREVPGNLLQ